MGPGAARPAGALVSETCISEVVAAKLDGGKIGEQLVALITSAGYPGEFIDKIKAAG